MRFELEIQYADYHPDQIDKVGQADLEQALKIIHSFPWDREFEKIEERSTQDLTSTIPNVTIRNKESELLIISARDRDNFIVEFQNLSHHGDLLIPNNSFDNKLGINIADVVGQFYHGTVKGIFNLKALTSTEVDDTEIFKLREYPLFISGFAAAILILILVFDFWSNGLTEKALPAIYFVGLMLFSMGSSAIVTIQYLLTDWGKEILFEDDGALTIKQKGKEVRLTRNDINQIAIIENENHRSLRYYKYARIKTKDDKTFIVTSFIIEPINLVNKLKVNHKDEPVFFPTINWDIVSEKEKQRIKRDKEKKRNEFLETFKNYEDSKLRQIVNDKKNYADYAIEAAAEILDRRKKNYSAQQRL